MAGSNIRPIRSETDYETAVVRISKIVHVAYGTPEADELQVLGTLVEAYENEHHTIGPPDPIEAILIRVEELGKTRKDLETILGGRSRVSEILKRRRHLSLNMVRQLARELKMPADILVQPYRLVRAKKTTRKGQHAHAG